MGKLTEEEKEQLMRAAAEMLATPIVFRGLCSTCDHASTCQTAQQASGPILFCELFENHAAPAATDAGDTPADSGGGKKNGPFKGLCVNCDSRHICQHAKSPDGVWHCEEYK